MEAKRGLLGDILLAVSGALAEKFGIRLGLQGGSRMLGLRRDRG